MTWVCVFTHRYLQLARPRSPSLAPFSPPPFPSRLSPGTFPMALAILLVPDRPHSTALAWYPTCS